MSKKIFILFFLEPFGRKLEYEINADFTDLSNYFAVDKTTGDVTVQKRVGFELDRDKEPFGTYTVELVVRDNRPATPGISSTHFCKLRNACIVKITLYLR
jgi:hypothetical protein